MDTTQPTMPSQSLQELAQRHPSIWVDVMTSLRVLVEKKQISQLATLSQSASATIARWLAAANTPIGQTDHARHEVIKAQMTKLAIEQFIDAYTSPDKKISLWEKLTLYWKILRPLEAGTLLTLKQLQTTWSKILSPGSAAMTIQNAGFWSIPTTDSCLALKGYIADRPVLELGAGRGAFVAGLKDVGVNIIGVDDMSWPLAKKTVKKATPFMEEISAEHALQQKKPSVVLSVWPPPGNLFERHVFNTPSVDLYMVILSAHQFASGNWSDYKAQDGRRGAFSCVTNESLNTLLRPIESEQRLLIFRRRKT